MARLKLTKTVVETAQPEKEPYELRDAAIPGFLLKVTPMGRKVFMVDYVANNGQRRKPAIGRFGEITVEQARAIAQDWLADVRKGKDPGAEKSAARRAPTVKELFDRFITDYSEPSNKPSTVDGNRGYGRLHIIPHLGQIQVADVTRAEISSLLKKMAKSPPNANRVLSAVRKMFNMAEVWGMRSDGSNPCRHVPKFPERGKTRLITDAELKRLYAYLNKAEAEGLEHPFILLAIRLQAEALRLLEGAPRLEESPYVCPSIFDPNRPMSKHTYSKGWRRILGRAGLAHIGTHGIRHRSATDIANSGVPVKVGMALTAHKTVTMFMRYVHTEDDPVRAAADAVGLRRQTLIGGVVAVPAPEPAHETILAPPSIAPEPMGGEFRHPTNASPIGRFGETQSLQTAVGNGEN